MYENFPSEERSQKVDAGNSTQKNLLETQYFKIPAYLNFYCSAKPYVHILYFFKLQFLTNPSKPQCVILLYPLRTKSMSFENLKEHKLSRMSLVQYL